MVRIEDVVVSFDLGGGQEHTVLNKLSLEVKQGQTVSIIGSNGAGKSTLLNSIAGSIPLHAGHIHLNGEDVTSWAEWERARYLGRVRQDPMAGTAGEMTVIDNLALAARKGPRRFRIATPPRFAREMERKLAELGMGLESRLRENVSRLSGGQRQALTLLMAVISHPTILLLDEHTAALDPANAEIVDALTRRFINEYDLTALIITHDMKRALEQASRVIMMHEGEIIADLSGPEKEKMNVAALVRLFKKVRGSEYAEDRDLLI
ncbi:MAG TPA: ATP-binding cassette domain-containing protein [Rectinema sp.]|jgi:putative ABC transport system ATP-binding protein|nr:ATP-binding cassette domain-containing protein [Spirochaetia bacterium]MDI9426692.1 ATP-binding cassette domain-containing protein [Spirochaetota bacterium]NLH89620.1 ATP-binding cassette domain-containing protein [Treponema sp.]HNT59595.1 ATP-binding cassette domain-containing protein [Rectinema sp.]HOI98277.1 ATP-binding cassette domain-containing protein [Rectinema sp.]